VLVKNRIYSPVGILVLFAIHGLGCSTEAGSISGTGGASGESNSRGTSPGTGGTGGNGTGGTSSGGMTSTGGAPSTGGAASGGSPGSTGGDSSTAGSGGAIGTTQSAGCGNANPVPCDTSGSPCTISANGKARAYYVVLPDNYDESNPYPVVFQFHPLGGNAEQGMNMYNFRAHFPDAIYVTPDGLTSGQFQGWSNTDGEDEELTRNIVAMIEEQYCIDKTRYFSGGFSFGGSMSYTAALCMDDIFRAVGVMAGAPISGASSCDPDRPVAAWINHGTADDALQITLSEPLRDELVVKNGCGTMTKPIEPSPCVAYDDCDSGFPVVWCEQEGVGHAIPSYGAKAITDFFRQF